MVVKECAGTPCATLPTGALAARDPAADAGRRDGPTGDAEGGCPGDWRRRAIGGILKGRGRARAGRPSDGPSPDGTCSLLRNTIWGATHDYPRPPGPSR